MDDFGQAKENLKCPLSGKIFEDPVTLNGHVYEREAIEDYLFENNWSDPAAIFNDQNQSYKYDESRSDKSSVSPNDILEVSEEFQLILK